MTHTHTYTRRLHENEHHSQIDMHHSQIDIDSDRPTHTNNDRTLKPSGDFKQSTRILLLLPTDDDGVSVAFTAPDAFPLWLAKFRLPSLVGKPGGGGGRLSYGLSSNECSGNEASLTTQYCISLNCGATSAPIPITHNTMLVRLYFRVVVKLLLFV